MVYYRKYRPQTIAELDLKHVREKLADILLSKELPHAFLFTGSKGLGKTSAARILAKAINCENRFQVLGSRVQGKAKEIKSKGELQPTLRVPSGQATYNLASGIEPCNKCEVCVSITNGSNLDVLEIDAASNGGVEEIRALRERVKFASATLRQKVYIIDEVHMLSSGAFNALLKTLEEPPSHVVFILATTELHKLPETVVSRTFEIKFEKPTEEEVIGSLLRIVKGEGLKIDKEVFHDIFVKADGSFRDGAKTLEELFLASKDKKITKELMESTFKTGSIQDEVYSLLVAFSRRDAKSSLETISRLSSSGSDFKAVTERMVEHLRAILMLRNNIKSEEKDVSELKMHDIKELLELANEAYGELRLSVIPQLPLELMAVKFCIIDVEGRGQAYGESTVLKQNEPEVSQETVADSREIKVEDVKVAPIKELQVKTPSLNRASKDVLRKLFELVNQNNKPAAALLRSCSSAAIDGNKITITTPYPIHAERLRSDNVFPDIQRASRSLIGKKAEIEIRILAN